MKKNPNPNVKPAPKANSLQGMFMDSALKEHASTLTKKAMKSTFNSLAKVAKAGHWANLSPQTITQKQFTKYIEQRKAEGLAPRTLKNQAWHIRRAVELCGRKDFADTFTNKDLGIPRASYIGKGKAIEPEVLQNALARADRLEKAVINLTVELGLRAREVVRSGESLKSWERQISTNQLVYLHDGAKTGRSRQIYVPPETREKALSAVREMIEVVKEQGGRVIDKDGLDQAMDHLRYRMEKLGIKGDNSFHSLRRDFAVTRYDYYIGAGFSKVEARCRLSVDLGHGDSRQRGTVAWNNYVRSTVGAANEAAYEEAA